MENVFLSDAKVSLVSVTTSLTDHSSRRPAIAIHADLSRVDYDDIYFDDEQGSYRVLAHQMLSVSPVSQSAENPMVKIEFILNESTMVSFRMPVQFLALSYTLSASDDMLGTVPIIFFDSNEVQRINPAQAILFDMGAFTLQFPNKESEEGAALAEVFSTLIHKTVAYPLAPYKWDDVDNHGPSEQDLMALGAMGTSLNAVLSLIRGDLSPIFSLPENFDGMEDDEVVQSIGFHIYLMHRILEVMGLSSPAMGTAYSVDKGNEKNLSKFGHFEFNRMLQDAELEESFNKILQKEKNTQEEGDASDDEHTQWVADLEIWNSKAEDSWPTQMLPIREYFESIGDLELLSEIIDADLSDLEVLGSIANDKGGLLTLMAVYIRVAMQAYKKRALNLNDADAYGPQDIVISWFSVVKSDTVWELASTASELSSFSTKNTADVLLFGSQHSENGFKSPYLVPAMVYVGALLLEDKNWGAMETEDLEQAISELDYNTDDFKGFKALILQYHQKMHEVIEEMDKESEASALDISFSAIQTMFNPQMNFRRIAEHFALVFPALAEIKANMSEAEKFSDEWQLERETYLHITLAQIADEIERIKGHVEFP